MSVIVSRSIPTETEHRNRPWNCCACLFQDFVRFLEDTNDGGRNVSEPDAGMTGSLIGLIHGSLGVPAVKESAARAFASTLAHR